MKILFVSAVFPYPLYSGGQVRIYNLLKALGGLHQISLFAFTRRHEERQYASKLPFCHKVVTTYRGRAWRFGYLAKAVFGSYPWVFVTYDNAAMRDAIAHELEKDSYDLIHIEPGYVWPSLPPVNLPIVVGEHNVEHHIYEGYVRQFPIPLLRPFLSFDVDKLKTWEKKVWRQASSITTVSEDDKKEILSEVGGKSITVVSNGVDIDEFTFHPRKNKKENAPIALFVGNFRWMQNRDALQYLLSEIWPQVKNICPAITLRVVGKHLPQTLKLPLVRTGGELLEHVADIQEELYRADVLLAPIRVGGGTKFKILEAMASGLPVVTTTIGAQGLAVEHGKELMIADTPDAIVRAMNTLVTNAQATLHMAKRARALIERVYSWKSIARSLDTVWKNAYEKIR